MIRQAVISIFKANPDGTFREFADKNIVFRQPFNNFGLAFSFNFSKSIFAPVTDCQIVIQNPGDDIGKSLEYEYSESKKRPLIRIYAGYSSFMMRAFTQININALKSTLNQVYAGFPFFYSDDKLLGGREISIELTDLSLFASKERISKSFRVDTSITDIVKKLLNEFVEIDTTALEDNIDFSLLKIEFTVIYNNRLVLEDIIPDLERQYNFIHFTNNEGIMVFRPGDDQGVTTGATQNKVNSSNGLIEFANTMNWVDISFRTFFGRPDIFYPGDRVSVKAPNLNKLKDTEGRIISAEYNFDDADAEISYVMNQFGQVANSKPFLKV
ncbi:MAG: hypothetical protein IID03_12690 [Candidatus Dadabacteria bacterium]|nr:hypothetical protein [Candidatus Dadabacteria bacterium]